MAWVGKSIIYRLLHSFGRNSNKKPGVRIIDEVYSAFRTVQDLYRLF